MQGSPPAPDRVIRFADGSSRQFPQLCWSFSHNRELHPTLVINPAAEMVVARYASHPLAANVNFDPTRSR